MSFDLTLLPEELRMGLEDQGFTELYPIQKQSIPAILEGKDVLGISKTGSGKTASYVLPILAQLQKKLKRGFELKNRHVHALILAPTRELAAQIEEVFHDFQKHLTERIKTMAVYGGVSINPQMIGLQGVHILVATPGRLLDLVDSKAVHLSELDVLVLDEADKMLNLGFKEEMGRILMLLPTIRQNLLFSATLSADLEALTDVLLNDPTIIEIAPPKEDIELIQQKAYLVADEKKGPLLRYLIKSDNLKQVLVFTSSIYKADNVANKLRKNGIEATAIHGKKSQGARKDALKKFKSGTLNVLVTTDLLSRGIDIECLPYVINYELPRSPKDFIHRIGRTGRAEVEGHAITFVTMEEKKHFKVIQKKMKIRVDLIDAELIDLHKQ